MGKDIVAGVEIYKDGVLVALALPPNKANIPPFFDGVDSIKLYYFKRISLVPTVVFEHLSGGALAKWLNDCQMVDIPLGGPLGPEAETLKYVHGRSEVMRGKTTISSVLLADLHFNRHMEPYQWSAYLPEIYRKFLALGPTERNSS
jgi:hypothetical protein